MKFKSAALLAIPLLALAACGQSEEPTTSLPAPAASTPAATSAAATSAAAAPSGGKIGAKGSACKLPVEFEFAQDWKPKAVTVDPDDELEAALGKRGDLTMACEIDAKPAGNIGFLRVWTAKVKGPKKNLEAYLGKDAIEPAYTDLKIGGRPAVEVVYQKKSELDDSLEQERAFAVGTGKGTVVVVLDSFDNDEHEAMLPAYELAKATLTV
ncbi:lipoprotein [Actinoplanes aureus]|uniref:Lipoprotein n=1 Tax=Actinoplanes aureus TaxID=2792083 RepID=A0A931FYX0_9ACTN|nr:lipoprotein [Actinoplanes aureus]MBG0562366.1 hypothetical protein [Actinoplanes aureus]